MSSNKRLRLSDPCSSFQKRFKYDVFISFRGEDTRKTFVGHLYQALEAKCIETYKDDDKIEKGENIDDQLLKSIEESRFFIIVFSKTYASSSWCLDELVKIIECQKKIPVQTAYPVFFDVEPTQVRKQNGPVGEAFSKQENQEAVGKWRHAMNELADLAGWELKTTANGDESKLIQIIADAIFKKLHSTNSSADGKLVGMETRMSDVLSSLEIGTEDVRIIGIKGIGGGGKTTLARAVYDRISTLFEGKSFVENVREVSKPTLSGLKKLQKRILKDVLNKQDITFSSVHDGKNMLKATMHCRKMLVVLDDVDRIEQLEALAGSSDWSKSGSRIIITTRDEQVLLAHGVNFIHDVNLLSSTEAICLFSRYAFQKEIPIRGYEELSGQVVQYAAGLPLTLKVMGSFLFGKDKLVWVDAIDRLEKIPLKETLKQLELSYTSLEDEYKEIFLDIACIFKGKHKEDAIRILECCGFHGRNGLKVLEQISLITISKDGELGMHDHIEEMGKNIVRREHPDEPNKHSHLWIDEEIEDILANDMGTEATRCLRLDMPRENLGIVMKGLEKMKKLRYLEVHFPINRYVEVYFAINGSDPKFDDTSKYFPSSLKYLKYCWYPYLYLPKTLQANNLVGLDMKYSRMVQLQEEGEKKVLNKLKFLSLDASKLTNFDFWITPNLETLSLTNSPNIVEICMPFTCQKLKHLHISNSKLRNFDLGLTPNIETLSLIDCADFEELHVSVTCPNLKSLNLCGSRLRSLDLELIPNLEKLELEDCAHFLDFHVSVACPNLKILNLRKLRLRSLDLELIPNIEKLELEDCAHFLDFHVSAACPNLKILNLRKSRLRSLDLELIPNLERLDLAECHELVEINAPVRCLKKVGYLNLSGCLRFPQFVFGSGCDPKVNCSSAILDLTGEFLDFCPLHPNSSLPKLQFRCYYGENLPSSVGNIEKLLSFGLCACTDLKKISDMICSLQCSKKITLKCCIPEFPKDLGQLECLEELHLSSTKIKHHPDSICMLKRLKSLRVNSGNPFKKLTEDLLEKLPEGLGQLECLEKLYVRSEKIEYLLDSICMLKRLKELYVTDCCHLGKLPEDLGRLACLEKLHVSSKIIEFLPDSICMLKRLKLLAVKYCSCLGKLPEDIDQLESLESLDLWGTMIKHLPDSICMLKHLKYLNLGNCALLEKLPEDLGRLECLEHLDITFTRISHLPQSIFGLKGLCIAAPRELLELYDFPSGIKTTTLTIW